MQNVRFLANFITDAGIIIKRSKVNFLNNNEQVELSTFVLCYRFNTSQTGISAKAQRKVAREIKTARAFGLMPFTTMGTKSFIFGRTMENLDKDFEYEVFDDNADADGGRPLGS